MVESFTEKRELDEALKEGTVGGRELNGYLGRAHDGEIGQGERPCGKGSLKAWLRNSKNASVATMQ